MKLFHCKKKETPVNDILENGTTVKFFTDDPDFKKYNNKKAIVLNVLPEEDTNCEGYCYRIKFIKSGSEIDAFDYELVIVE